MLKRVFEPPRREQLETLEEKTCLAFFVDNVLFRLFSALKLSMSQVSVFYRAWDAHRVVLSSYEQVTEDDSRISRFKKYLQVQKQCSNAAKK